MLIEYDRHIAAQAKKKGVVTRAAKDAAHEGQRDVLSLALTMAGSSSSPAAIGSGEASGSWISPEDAIGVADTLISSIRKQFFHTRATVYAIAPTPKAARKMQAVVRQCGSQGAARCLVVPVQSLQQFRYLLSSKAIERKALILAGDDAVLEAAGEARRSRQQRDTQNGEAAAVDALDDKSVNGWNHARQQKLEEEASLFGAIFGGLPVVCVTGIVPSAAEQMASRLRDGKVASTAAPALDQQALITSGPAPQVSSSEAGQLGCKAYIDLSDGSKARRQVRAVFDNFFAAEMGVNVEKADAVLLEDTASGLLTLVNGEAYTDSLEGVKPQQQQPLQGGSIGGSSGGRGGRRGSVDIQDVKLAQAGAIRFGGMAIGDATVVGPTSSFGSVGGSKARSHRGLDEIDFAESGGAMDGAGIKSSISRAQSQMGRKWGAGQ